MSFLFFRSVLFYPIFLGFDVSACVLVFVYAMRDTRSVDWGGKRHILWGWFCAFAFPLSSTTCTTPPSRTAEIPQQQFYFPTHPTLHEPFIFRTAMCVRLQSEETNAICRNICKMSTQPPSSFKIIFIFLLFHSRFWLHSIFATATINNFTKTIEKEQYISKSTMGSFL